MPPRGMAVWPVRAGWPRPVGAAPTGGCSQRAEDASKDVNWSFAVGELQAARTREGTPTKATRRSMLQFVLRWGVTRRPASQESCGVRATGERSRYRTRSEERRVGKECR